jgi:hypothetical protein
LSQFYLAELLSHLEAEGVEIQHFSFRWMLLLLAREFKIDQVQRLWDTYISEGALSYNHFHPYVCAALLTQPSWREILLKLDFCENPFFLFFIS